MKRTISLWLGLVAFALLPVLAQTPTGKVHGHVTRTYGAPETTGSVSLSTDGETLKYTFPVSSTGDYAGEAPPGTYSAIYRAPDTPSGKMVDIIEGVKIVVGQDVAQDIDMSRKAYIDSLSSDMKKKVEEKKKEYAAVSKTNSVVKNLNADLKTCDQDLNDANAAHQAAVQALGATASSADIEAKEAEIRTAKFTEIETLMLKDTAAKPDASVLWAQLAQAQLGLKKYDEAEAAYKKALAADAASKKPDPSIQGAANAGLGEAYARTGKVPEANAAFDAAAKANPAGAANYFKNEAGIFSNLGNADAQVAAAQEAVKADPTLAFAYYLIGNGLVGKSVPDPKTNMLVPPPGCLEAYQMYLKLAPTGPYAADVKSILSSLQTALPPAATPAKSGKRK